MMPDLDRYAGTVLGAYGITLVLLGLLIVVSLRRASRVKRALTRIEAEDGRRRHGKT